MQRSNSTSSSHRVLILLTNEAFIKHETRWEEEEHTKQLGSEAKRDPRSHCKALTGADVYELAYLWIALTRKADIQVDLVSPWGGAVPSDPDSLQRLMKDETLLKEFKSPNDFITLMDHTYPIHAIRPEEYKAAIVIGSYGAMFDLPSCSKTQTVLTSIYANNGYLCTIGHGAAVLTNLHETRHSSSTTTSSYLISSKRIACPTNREEKEKRFEKILPFMIEDRLKERGAKIHECDPFKSNVVIDERLITAQNTASIRDFVRKIGEKVLNKSIEI
jgi:putative intracellular protease/amidase